MSIFRKAMVSIRRALSLTNPDGWRSTPKHSASGEPVTGDSVLALSAAWACVNLLAGTVATLPLMVYRTDAHGVRTVARDVLAYRLLHDSPNAHQTAVDFWEFVVASLELWGSAYARKIMVGQRLISLEPVRPDIVTVRTLQNGRLEYRWSEEGRVYQVDQDEMLHIRGFGGSPLGGMSTLKFGRRTFDLAGAIENSASSTFANGMRPAVQIKFDKFLTKEQREDVEEYLIPKYVGAMNAGRPFVMEGGPVVEPISFNPEDAQMLQSRGFSVEEVCRFFGVPPFMVGHTEKSTSWGTGIEQQTLGFVKFALRRRLKRIEQSLEKQILTAEERAAGISIEFNLEGLLRGDSKARAEFYRIMSMIGSMTINEIRALENRPPIEGGDVARMQAQNVPITEAPGITDGGRPEEAA